MRSRPWRTAGPPCSPRPDVLLVLLVPIRPHVAPKPFPGSIHQDLERSAASRPSAVKSAAEGILSALRPTRPAFLSVLAPAVSSLTWRAQADMWSLAVACGAQS